ncbi:MAG: IclR family transcriptional regulator [Comamonadaceae bacterium]|nr:MAG: IclR family transcriptional regulator [Comamonadaceae bacterium]
MTRTVFPPLQPLSDGADAPGLPPARARRQRVQSAETGMVVLKGLARLGGRASLTALAAHVGESPAKVHRYLASLQEEGLVAQDAGTQHYLLGAEAIGIGLAAMRQADPVRLAEPALARLRERLEVTSFVAVLGNRGPTVLRIEEPGLPVTVNVRPGTVLSLLWSATGRAFLGFLDDRSVRLMAEDELGQAPPALRLQLDAEGPIDRLRESVRTAGCASVVDTNLRGISAVSAPVHDHTGRVCAVITALGATGGFDASPEGAIARAVCAEARELGRLLGHQTVL